MNLSFKNLTRSLVTTLAVAGLMFPMMASAQPSYAQPSNASQDETIRGRIVSIDGTFNLSLNDDRGFVDNIELHQGTIINPTGLTLAPGMSVTITGYAEGSVFEANEIDTPYDYSGPAPVPVYYGAGWWYPGYSYGYGPSFLLAINFFGGGYHFEHRRFEGFRPWDGRGFFSGRIYVQGPRVVYSARSFNGSRDTRSYNAPRGETRSTYTAPQRTDTRSYNAPRTDTRTYVAPRSNPGTAYTRGSSDTTVRAYPSSSARTYQAPARTYQAPARTYQAPARTYQAPARTYQAPARTYQAPARDTSSHSTSSSNSRGSSNSSNTSSSKGDRHHN